MQDHLTTFLDDFSILRNRLAYRKKRVLLFRIWKNSGEVRSDLVSDRVGVMR